MGDFEGNNVNSASLDGAEAGLQATSDSTTAPAHGRLESGGDTNGCNATGSTRLRSPFQPSPLAPISAPSTRPKVSWLAGTDPVNARSRKASLDGNALPIRDLAMTLDGARSRRGSMPWMLGPQQSTVMASSADATGGSARGSAMGLGGAADAAAGSGRSAARAKSRRVVTGPDDDLDVDPWHGLHGAIQEDDEDGSTRMIGEVETVDMRRELRQMGWALAAAALIMVPCTLYHVYVSDVKEHGPGVLWWALFVVAVLISYPLACFLARTFSFVLTHYLSSLLFRGNALYFLVVLHHEIGLTLWSLAILVVWEASLRDVFSQDTGGETGLLLTRLVACFFALRVGFLVKATLTLFLAMRYLWKPYLKRVRHSIFAQYALLLLMDYCEHGTICKDDEAFAQRISDGRLQWGHLSLYAVSKAISFIPRNKLVSTLAKDHGIGDTLECKGDAEQLGDYLFRNLHRRSVEVQQEPCVSSVKKVPFFRRRTDEMAASVASVISKADASDAQHTPPDLSQPYMSSFTAAQIDSQRHTPPQPALRTTHSEAAPKAAAEAGNVASNGWTWGKGSAAPLKDALRKRLAMAPQSSPIPLRRYYPTLPVFAGQELPDTVEDKGVNGTEPSDSDDDDDDAQYDPDSGEKIDKTLVGVTLQRDSFCPALTWQMQDKVFALFDRDDSNDITHEEVVNGVVNIYKDHQSLALTLQDSQRMAHKLGEVLGAGILIALIFIWLRIFGRDIFALTLTFASVLVGVSVLIGPASANLFASIVFIFVQRPFDVGDRVFHWFPDGRGEMQNAVVTRIDLLITCFRAWDEKVYYLPNHVLATRPIINIQRSGDQWHEFFIQVLASTPSQKLWELKAKCVEFAEKHNKPSGIHPHIQFALTGVENTNRLTIRVCFRQKGNWQILSRKWAVQSMCTNCIVNSCKELGITYTQPQLPLDFNKQKLF